jgi:ankyrin repeat protein
MILALLEKGADAAKRTTKGEQPLHCAAEKGHVDAIGVLLDAPGSDVNAPGPYKATPLHVASTPAVAELLLARGADPTIKYRSRTPFKHHSEKGNAATARAIQTWDPAKAAVAEQKRNEEAARKAEEEEEAERKAMEAAAEAREAAAARAAKAAEEEEEQAAAAAVAKAAAAAPERSMTPVESKQRHWESSAGSPNGLARAAADEAEELDSDSDEEIDEEVVLEEEEPEPVAAEPERKLSPKALAPLGGLQPLKHTGGLPSLAPLGGTLSAGSSLGDPFTPGMGRAAPEPSPVPAASSGTTNDNSDDAPMLDSPPQ